MSFLGLAVKESPTLMLTFKLARYPAAAIAPWNTANLAAFLVKQLASGGQDEIGPVRRRRYESKIRRALDESCQEMTYSAAAECWSRLFVRGDGDFDKMDAFVKEMLELFGHANNVRIAVKQRGGNLVVVEEKSSSRGVFPASDAGPTKPVGTKTLSAQERRHKK
ncbi:MAG TPA: hypothetical protein VIW73_08800 [Candidatus Cybelea sp.]